MSQTRAQLVKGFSNTSASDDAVTVDSNGNVGIGVTPSSWGGSRNAIQFDSAGAAYVCNDTTVGIVSNMYFDGSNNKYINAGTASSAYFQQDNVVFQFAPSGSADGNGTFTTSTRIDADGIKFGSDTAAENALDDYEEGDWTPDLQFGGAKVGITYANQYGKYVKIGRLVHVFGRVTLSSKGSSGGIARFFGLPYVTESITGTTMNIGSIWYSGFNLQGSIVQVVMRTDGNGNSFVEPKGVTTNTEDAIGDSDFTNSTDMCFSVTYRTT